MSDINQHNYEAFYLDYLEGNLNAEETAQLLLFLESNPDLKSGLENSSLILLFPDKEIQVDKNSIFKTINENTIEEYIVASIENELDTDDSAELQEYLSKSVKSARLAERYKKAILSQELIPFPEKNKLKKRGPAIYYMAPLVSVAAAVVFFLWINIPEPESHHPPTAFKNIKTNPKETVDHKYSQPDTREFSGKKNTVDHQAIAKDIKSKSEVLPTFTDRIVENKSLALEKESVFTENIPTIPDSVLIRAEEILKNNKKNEIAAVTENNQKNKVLTIGQWAKKKIKEKILKEEKNSPDTPGDNELLASADNKTNKSLNADIDYHVDETNNSTTFSFSIGKFSFSRTKSR